MGEPPSSLPKPRQAIREEGRSYGFKDLALAALPLTTQILQPRHLLRSKSLEVRTPGCVSGPALPRNSRAPSSRTSSGCTQSPSSRPPSLLQAQCSCRSPCDPQDPSRQRPRQLPGNEADTSPHPAAWGPAHQSFAIQVPPPGSTHPHVGPHLERIFDQSAPADSRGRGSRRTR